MFAPSGGSSWTEIDELVLAQHPRQLRLLGHVVARGEQLALADDQRRGRRAAPRRPPPGWPRSARASCRSSRRSAPRRAGAPAPRTRRSTRASRAGRSRVSRRGSRGRRWAARRATSPSDCISASAFSAAAGPALWFAPIAATLERGEPLGGGARRHAAERLTVGVEGHQRDDRQLRDRAHRLDRGDELVEVVERLEHEQVDAAAFQHLGLLGDERRCLGRIEVLRPRPAGRSSRR